MSSTLVFKFGGTSLGSLKRIRAVAEQIAAESQTGRKIAVVVSAMAQETDRLIKLAHELAVAPPVRELDALLATGEQCSAALLCMALAELGIDARSYNAAQLPIKTDGNYGRARITGIDTGIIMKTMGAKRLAVVTGFQGIDRLKNINTLGRGGSDTSAVALAIALQAKECRIYTDVDGVYTADPRLVSDARLLNVLSYEEMLEMASQGSKVLHSRSVELAARNKMPLRVLSSMTHSNGSLITSEQRILKYMENAEITAISHQRDEAKITVCGVPNLPGLAARVLRPIADENINVDIIVQNVGNSSTDLSFTVNRHDMQQAAEIIDSQLGEIGAKSINTKDNIAKVSVVGIGMKSYAGVASKMFDTLARENINIEMISTSEIRISVIIEERHTERAVRSLHRAFNLKMPDPLQQRDINTDTKEII